MRGCGSVDRQGLVTVTDREPLCESVLAGVPCASATDTQSSVRSSSARLLRRAAEDKQRCSGHRGHVLVDLWIPRVRAPTALDAMPHTHTNVLKQGAVSVEMTTKQANRSVIGNTAQFSMVRTYRTCYNGV
jgi:hypothetical protein